MPDLDANGNVVTTGQDTYDARRNNNAHDIRRAVAPPPTVLSTINVNSSSGFTGAASFLSSSGMEGGVLNSGILLRAVQCNSTNTIFVGLTAAGLDNSSCFLMEANDEIFIPLNRLSDLSFKTVGTNGMTLSALGE